MKKLNLKLEGIKEMLTKEQMKKVVGGHGYLYGYEGNCMITCYHPSGNVTYHPACGCHTGEFHRHCGIWTPDAASTWTCIGSDCDRTTNTPWCGPYNL